MGITTMLISFLAGAGLMYFLDPRAGNRRRTLAQDQLTKLRNTTSDHVEGLKEDISNRGQGAIKEAARYTESEDITDATLVARVRSEMGRYVSHSSAIEVTANAGVVTLKGNILEAEMPALIAKVESMPNVRQVVNQLSAHKEAGNVPDLQGGTTPTELH